MTPRFVAGPPAERVAIALDAMTLVYHRPSGATHLLAPPAPEMLDALGEVPCDAAGLLDRLSARFDVADADPNAIAARFDELADAGLVRRV